MYNDFIASRFTSSFYLRFICWYQSWNVYFVLYAPLVRAREKRCIYYIPTYTFVNARAQLKITREPSGHWIFECHVAKRSFFLSKFFKIFDWEDATRRRLFARIACFPHLRQSRTSKQDCAAALLVRTGNWRAVLLPLCINAEVFFRSLGVAFITFNNTPVYIITREPRLSRSGSFIRSFMFFLKNDQLAQLYYTEKIKIFVTDLITAHDEVSARRRELDTEPRGTQKMCFSSEKIT